MKTIHLDTSKTIHLNTSKTKEIVIDFRKGINHHNPITIKGDNIQMVDEYKYLGTITDAKLSWKANTGVIFNPPRGTWVFFDPVRTLRFPCHFAFCSMIVGPPCIPHN
jgi:hypothetical protein